MHTKTTGEQRRLGHGPALGEAFESRPNALNFIRLGLALQVILWHSYGLLGDTWMPARAEALLSDIAVDGFFAISGFLICRAWVRRPQLGAFLAARAKRILPGLWVCLIVTAYAVAPLTAWLAGGAQPSLAGQLHYVLGNAGTWVHQWGIDGGPVGVPRPGSWNGSLWSLGYEACCYLAVAALGVARLLRPRVMVALAGGFWVFSAALVSAGFTGSGQPVWCTPRCGLMFTTGALLFLFRDRVPVSGRLALLAAAMVVVGVVALPADYRLIAAPAVAYLCMTGGLWFGRWSRLALRNDLSYGVYVYGFVTQQALLVVGVRLSWAPFALLSFACVLPVAALSWFLVERPAQRLWRRKLQPTSPQVPVSAVGAAPEVAAA